MPDDPPTSDPAPEAPSPKKDVKTEEDTPESTDAKPATDSEPVDMGIFSQILELDEEGTHEFSKDMVGAYFLQATSTFDNMDTALADENLPELSSLGHFLKGSSAALGISKVQAGCEKMQYYGELRDGAAGKELTSTEALDKIKATLLAAKDQHAAAEQWFKKWFKEQNDPFDDDDDAAEASKT
ncbi:signal transduction histidine kinase [Favolaschia claudopus]|uniref:Signal transduction histidine kinase n=1 Tax=Favolaschia claudopus TaxID=2862362 RepID=A0AAW0DAM6_9AGAR